MMKETKAYLNQLHRLDSLISSKLIELNTLREIATSISAIDYSIDRVQSSSEPDRIGNTIAKIVKLENDINKSIDSLIDKKRDVMETIDKVKDHDLRLLLQLRYLQFHTWESIAVEMDYSYRWIHKLHSMALEEVKKLICA